METRVPSKVVSFRHFFEGLFWHHLFLGRLDTVWLVISLFIEYQYHHLGWLFMTRNRATFDFNGYYCLLHIPMHQCTNAPQWNSIGFGHFSPELLPDSPWKGTFKGLSKCFFMQLVFLHAEFGPSKGVIRGEKLSWIGRVLITSQKWWNILQVDFFLVKIHWKIRRAADKKALKMLVEFEFGLCGQELQCLWQIDMGEIINQSDLLLRRANICMVQT